ncbi:gene transfer agent family protein [Phyllobacterium meliloti]|nr:gene transfer agent family protein [Phyllobacterium sp. T1293]
MAKIQEACDAGPYVVLHRLSTQSWLLNDIKEVIRWGLIGGGMTPLSALNLVRDYVEGRPPVESVMHAQAILSAGLMGAPEEELGKDQAASREANHSTTSPTES